MPAPHVRAGAASDRAVISPVIACAWLAIAWSVLAFGAVYPWGYWPLLGVLAGAGALGIVQPGADVVAANRRAVLSVVVLVAPILIQLVPLPREALQILTPRTGELLQDINLAYAASPGAHPLSLDPAATLRALAFVACLGVFVLGLARRLSTRDAVAPAAALVVGIVVLGVVVALIAIVQRSTGSGLIYGFWKPQQGGIPYGPFVNRNHFAGWMVMVLSLALGDLCGRTASLAQQKLPGWRARILWLSSPEASKIVLLGAAVAVMSVALVLTLSRSGIAAFAVAIVIMGAFVHREAASARRKLALAAYLAIIVVVGVLATGMGVIAQRFAAANWHELGDRRTAWAIARQIASDFPLTGAGINTFGTLSPVYTKNALPVHYGEAHNDYLQLAAEGGLLVCIPAAAVMWLLVVEIRRRFRDADRSVYWLRAGAATGVLAIAVQEVVDFSLQVPANAACLAMLLAIAIHQPRPRTATIERRDSCAPPRRPSRH